MSKTYNNYQVLLASVDPHFPSATSTGMCAQPLNVMDVCVLQSGVGKTLGLLITLDSSSSPPMLFFTY